MNTDRLARIGELDVRKKELGDELDEIKKERKELEDAALDEFADAGVSSMKVHGRTVYVRRELWATAAKGEDGDSDYDSAVEALRESGLGWAVQERFNAQTLSGYVRNELPTTEDGQPIVPPEWKGRIDVAERFSIRTRRS